MFYTITPGNPKSASTLELRRYGQKDGIPTEREWCKFQHFSNQYILDNKDLYSLLKHFTKYGNDVLTLFETNTLESLEKNFTEADNNLIEQINNFSIKSQNQPGLILDELFGFKQTIINSIIYYLLTLRTCVSLRTTCSNTDDFTKHPSFSCTLKNCSQTKCNQSYPFSDLTKLSATCARNETYLTCKSCKTVNYPLVVGQINILNAHLLKLLRVIHEKLLCPFNDQTCILANVISKDFGVHLFPPLCKKQA